MSRRTPGMPIPGTERTITAAEIAAALGLKPGRAPKEDGAPAMTPNQARKLMSDEWPDETPDIGWETHTIPAGRDVADALGVDLAKLPVGVEAELGPPQPRPERRPEAESSPPPRKAESNAAKTAAAEVRRKVRAHAEKVAARAVAAKGTPHEAAAVRDVERTTELVKAASAKLGSL